jgi:hypothetical protein
MEYSISLYAILVTVHIFIMGILKAMCIGASKDTDTTMLYFLVVLNMVLAAMGIKNAIVLSYG